MILSKCFIVVCLAMLLIAQRTPMVVLADTALPTLPDSEIQALSEYPNWVGSQCSPASSGTTPASPTGDLQYVSAGNIPASGKDVGASLFGGTYQDGSFTPTNDVQGGPQPHDDNGAGNGAGSPAGHAAYAELSSGAGNDYSAMGNLPEHTKLAITYKGKTVIAEKLDVGAGGDSVNGKARVIDLWWETAKLLNFTGGTDVVNIRPVTQSTPPTPVDVQPTDIASAPSAQCACPSAGSGSGGASLSGKTNAQKAFNYFVGTQGLSAEVAAGIVGNMMTESGGNTENLDTHAHNDISGTHDGIVQWSTGRWASLKSHENGKDIYDLATQLDYTWYELHDGGYKSVLSAMKSASSAAAAATIFNMQDEVSGDNSGNREANATKIFKNYGKDAGGGGSIGSPAVSGDCSAATTTVSGGPVNIIKHDSFGNADGLMGHQPTMIGLHYTAGNEKTVDDVVSALGDPTGAKHCNKSCSVQLTIDPKGNVYQLTSRLDVITENIINFNDADIGIEIMGPDEQALLNNKTQFDAVTATVIQLMQKYNIKMVEDFSNKAGLMGHIECDTWSQAHIGDRFKGTYGGDPAVESTDSHEDPGLQYMAKVRAVVGPAL